jgi:hypothetical protein
VEKVEEGVDEDTDYLDELDIMDDDIDEEMRERENEDEDVSPLDLPEDPSKSLDSEPPLPHF